jgi:hypothetical protein
MSSKHWLLEFLARTTDLEASVLAIGCWHICDATNDARNNHTIPEPKRTIARIIVYVDKVIQHCFKENPGSRRESNRAQKWTPPPPPGKVLINVVVALFVDLHRMAMGAVF